MIGFFSFQYQESVSKLKAEYEKNLEVYKIAKARYEDQYVKGKLCSFVGASVASPLLDSSLYVWLVVTDCN